MPWQAQVCEVNPRWRWYDLGRYRILAMPLPTNPYWTTHRVFLNGKMIGRQLSVPAIEDCDHLARWGEQYAEHSTWRVFSQGRRRRAA